MLDPANLCQQLKRDETEEIYPERDAVIDSDRTIKIVYKKRSNRNGIKGRCGSNPLAHFIGPGISIGLNRKSAILS